MGAEDQVATSEDVPSLPPHEDSEAETQEVKEAVRAEMEEAEEEARIASSAQEVIAAATASQAKRIQTIPFCGTNVKVRPCSRTAYYSTLNLVQKMAKAGRKRNENFEADLAWVKSCVIEPKFDHKELLELANVAPSDFSTLATLCEQLSGGTPPTVLCIQIWSNQAFVLKELEAEGKVPEGTFRFFSGLIKVFNSFLTATELEEAPDLRVLGQRLVDEDDDLNMEIANEAIQEWLQGEEEDAKNSSEPETSGSTPPA